MIDKRIYEKFGVLQYMLVLQELHKQGYQKLRWFSYMSPNGCAMRCHFTMQDNICMRRGELKHCDTQHAWNTSTSQADTNITDVLPYIDEFKREMSVFIDRCKGCDSAYVKWFDAVVEEAKKGHLPEFYGEYWNVPLGQIKVGGKPYPCPPHTEPDL